jgi:hypothetical protein
VTFEEVRALLLSFPGVVEGTSYGTPGFRVGKAFLTRLHDAGDAMVVRVGFDEREMLMAAEPDTFHITDHYRGYPAVLVRFATVAPGTLRRLYEAGWRERAPKRLVAAFDAERAAAAHVS